MYTNRNEQIGVSSTKETPEWTFELTCRFHNQSLDGIPMFAGWTILGQCRKLTCNENLSILNKSILYAANFWFRRF